jgi:hypothetical protein
MKNLLINCVLGLLPIWVPILAISLLVACSPGDDRWDMCKFKPGQLVRSVVSGEVGQVIANRLGGSDWCYADVRFQGNQEFTDSRVLSNDGPISVRALTIVKYMRPYELEHVEEQ